MRPSTRVLGSVIVIAAALVFTASAGTALARYWWTPAAAGRTVVAWNPAVYPRAERSEVDVTRATCSGRGTANMRRFLAFRCAAMFASHTVMQPAVRAILWVKVRKVGAGQPCVSLTSLAAVAPGCLTGTRQRKRGSRTEATIAFRKTIGGPGGLYQGETDCPGSGAGFYACTAGPADNPLRTGTVTFNATGPPAVRITG